MSKFDADNQINRIQNAFSPLNDSVTPPLEISPFMIEREAEKMPKPKRKISKSRIVVANITLAIVLCVSIVGFGVLNIYNSNSIMGAGYDHGFAKDNTEQTTAIGTTAANSNIAATAAASTAGFKDNTAISAATSSIIEQLNKLYSSHKTYTKKSAFAQEVEGYTGGDENGYSETNVQEQGVNEGDTVLTDGEYIYKIRVDEVEGKRVKDDYIANYIEIINAKTMKKCAQIKEKSKYHRFAEMYLSDNLLTVLETRDFRFGETETDKKTVVRIYDVSDKTTPKQRSEYAVTGTLASSRMVDGVLYTVTSDYIYVGEKVTKDNLNSFLPTVKSNGEVKSCAIKDVFSLGDYTESFVSFTALNTKDKSAKMNIKSLLCGGVDVYYTKNSAYLFETIYDYDENGGEEKSRTDFMKLNLSGDKIYAGCKFTVKGSVETRLNMSERNGYFRVVTTESTYKDDVRSSKSGVYVFDKNGKMVGSIMGLGIDEDVYSVRFDGDMCYFVTYKTKDPLFAVDLSNPKKPMLKSELELPGYSTFLYRVRGYLVGIGNNDYGDPKISLFSKDGKTELDTVNLDSALKVIMKLQGTTNEYGIYEENNLYNVYSPAVYDFHSFCANEKSGEIIIPYSVGGDIDGEHIEKSGLVIYTVNSGKLKVKKVLLARSEKERYEFSCRAMYIDNCYFYIDGECIIRYDSSKVYASVRLNF